MATVSQFLAMVGFTVAFDPTISLGNVLTIGSILVAGVSAVSWYKARLDNVIEDLTDIKSTLKDQDKASRDRDKADALADGIISVLQQRVITLEGEMNRCRANIHSLANTMQVEIATRQQQTPHGD